MMEFMTGPILARLQISGQPLTQDFAATIVDNLLRSVVNTNASLADSTPSAPFCIARREELGLIRRPGSAVQCPSSGKYLRHSASQTDRQHIRVNAVGRYPTTR